MYSDAEIHTLTARTNMSPNTIDQIVTELERSACAEVVGFKEFAW